MQTDNKPKRVFKPSSKKGRKFIQICARLGWVHALDAAGRVYEYHPDEGEWRRLSDKRKPYANG